MPTRTSGGCWIHRTDIISLIHLDFSPIRRNGRLARFGFDPARRTQARRLCPLFSAPRYRLFASKTRYDLRGILDLVSMGLPPRGIGGVVWWWLRAVATSQFLRQGGLPRGF